MDQRDGENIRLGFVVAEFNRDITYQMEILAKEHAAFLSADVVKTIYVPGVFDMPLAIKNLALDDEVDAVVTIGCVIAVSYTHLRAHETDSYLVCRLLLEKKKKKKKNIKKKKTH